MPVYAIYAFLGLLFIAWSSILLKFTAKHKVKNPLVFYFYYLVVYFSLGLLIFFIKPIDIIPPSFNIFKPVLVYTIITFISFFFFFFNLYKLDITTFAPLYNFRAIFSTVLAVLFLGVIISTGKIPWLLTIFVAGFFVSIDEKMSLRTFFQKPVFGFLLYVFGLAVLSVLANVGVTNVGYWNFLFYTYVYGSLWGILILPKIYKEIKISFSQFWPILVSTGFECLGYSLYVKAVSQNVIVSTVILSFPISSVFTYIISRFKPELLEHHTTKVYLVRFLAISLMFIASIMLAHN